MGPVTKLNKIQMDFLYGIIISSLTSAILSLIIDNLSDVGGFEKFCIFLMLFSIVFMIYCYLHNLKRKVVISAKSFFIFKKNGDAIRMPEYLLNQNIVDILNDYLVNNKEYKNKCAYVILPEHKDCDEQESDRPAFLKDAIEFDFLNWLSCVYFSCTNNGYENRFIQRDISLSNLIVLDDIKIDRDKNGNLELKNSYYTIKLSADCVLVKNSFPSEYPELILNCNSEELIVYCMNVNLSVIFNVQRVALSYNSSKLKWIDDMVENFEEYYSFEKYLDKIHFYFTKSIVRALQGQNGKSLLNREEIELQTDKK